MKSELNKRSMLLLGAVAMAGAVNASTVVMPKSPIALSDGGSGDKPKAQRAGDGTLVAAYGDTLVGAGWVYDVKGDVERTARDIFVKTCKPSLTKTCDLKTDWSAPVNVSKSALQLSTGSFDWRGELDDPATYPGDIDKANIKTSGPMMVLTWVSKYCPDGDLVTAGIQPSVQRGVRYLERDGGRIIPFSCAWTAYSTNNGVSWSAPIQLSTGERDAIQDASSGNINTDITSPSYKKGQINISWQEDPQGLQLGEADGPGDGASGANVSNGTDVWYAYATVDLSVPSTPADDFVLTPGARLTDNMTGLGIGGADEANPVFDGAGLQIDKNTIEKGQAGAARPNIGMVGTTAIVAYEETKGSEGLDEGKFIRYHAFPFNTLPATAEEKAGCIISDPVKNARRVRFLTQSPSDAGSGGIQLGIFWKEGAFDKGGPSDIIVRRGMGGLQPANMVPAVDAACATSDYATAIALTSTRGQNISSRAPDLTVSDSGLLDDTEVNDEENALAHRGVLRGQDMWIGYTYTNDLVKMWAQQDNYNFWIRKYNKTTGWELPENVTNITDTRINVREPRIFGTPKSNATSCPTGIPTDPTTTDATQCQNVDVIYLAWGTQENVSPLEPAGGDDLGIYITVSLDSGESFANPVRYSTAMGSLFEDEESAFEAQVVTRPDGMRFYGVWNQANSLTGATAAEYASGDIGIDTDDDTILDPDDNCPLVPNTNQMDTDNDDIGNVCDDDVDGDGATNDIDQDDDGDGLSDVDEGFVGSDPINPDTDEDGVLDGGDYSPLDETVLGGKNGGAAKDYLGTSVAAVGDIDNDGTGDYAIGTPGYDAPATPTTRKFKDAGLVQVLSGKTGAVLMSAIGDHAKDELGLAVAGAGDVNNDGYLDVIIGCRHANNSETGLRDAGSVTVLFGPDASLPSRVIHGRHNGDHFGSAVAGADVNGDGFSDLIIGAHRDDTVENVNAGRVTVFSGEDNSELNQFAGETSNAKAGIAVASADIDNDGNADIIVGAPYDDDAVAGLKDAGSVTVYNIAGTQLMKKYGSVEKAGFGLALAAGDVNGDGRADVVVGAPGDDNLYWLQQSAGSVTALSGVDGEQLTKKYGRVSKFGFGRSVAVADINNDGMDEIVVGTPDENVLNASGKLLKKAGSVSIFYGANNGYVLMNKLYGTAVKDSFGYSLAAGDVNDDGNGDVIIGVRNHDTPGVKWFKDAGSVQIHSGDAL
jgi:hypothetical protein